MTHRLYYTDAYQCDFEAAVVDRADGGRRIYLDSTAFYPASGGQPFDTGRLGGAEVIEVTEEGERIAHILAQPLSGDRVQGRVDWSRRFDHMQQHTGQHLLSAVLADQFGYATIGVHFGSETSTIDLDAAGLSPDQISKAEDRSNEIVVENRPVEVSFEDAQTAGGLRRATQRSGTIRVITIRNLDRSACGGTHVRATGEIGPILLRKVERVRKGVRVEFLCGGRAVRRARADHRLLSQMATEFSAAIDDLPGLITAQRAQLKEAVAGRQELATRLDLQRARELYSGATPDSSGIRRVVVREEAGSLETFRSLAMAFTSMPRSILVAATARPPTVLLASSPDSGIDAGAVLKGLLASAGGRGGGSKSLAQGSVPGMDGLEAVLKSLESRV